MSAGDANGRGLQNSWVSLAWALGTGLAMTAVYLLIIDWTFLVRWARTAIGHS